MFQSKLNRQTEANVKSWCRFLIIACDGLWDVVTHQEAVDAALLILDSTDRHLSVNPSIQQAGSSPLAEPCDAQQVCAKLVDMAMEAGSTDNITIVCVVWQRESTP